MFGGAYYERGGEYLFIYFGGGGWVVSKGSKCGRLMRSQDIRYIICRRIICCYTLCWTGGKGRGEEEEVQNVRQARGCEEVGKQKINFTTCRCAELGNMFFVPDFARCVYVRLCSDRDKLSK